MFHILNFQRLEVSGKRLENTSSASFFAGVYPTFLYPLTSNH